MTAQFKILIWALVLGPTSSFAVLESKLDYVVVKVNEVEHSIGDGGEFSAVAGDKVVLKGAYLNDAARRVANVNFVGYLHPEAERPAEDRGYVIDTGKDLLKHWSLEKKGERYRIKVFTGRRRHGEVYLRLVKPELKYVEMQINGQARMVRPGEILQVRNSDKFTVKSVETNIENDGEKVEFEVVPLADHVDLPDMKFYEIRFSRATLPFAKLSLQVRNIDGE